MCVRSRRLRVSTFLLVARTNLANRSKETDKYHSKKENAAVAAFKSADSQHLRVDFDKAQLVSDCATTLAGPYTVGAYRDESESDHFIQAPPHNSRARTMQVFYAF
jgi:hypothetical protein